MSLLGIFFIVAGVASLFSIPLAIYYARRQGQRQKLLAYDAGIARFPLISARSLEEYRLSVVYQPEGGSEERIGGAFVHVLRFANFGREPVRREDIAPHNPLRIEVRGTRVLDFAVEAVRRPVTNITVEQDIPLDEVETAAVNFDFLDYLDGAVIRIITTTAPDEIRLVGDIIGMPTGIQQARDVRRKPYLGWIGGGLAAATFILAFALAAFAFRWVSGSWTNIWLLALPLAAIILPGVAIALVGGTVWPKSGLQFPRELHHLRRMPPFAYMEMEAGGPVFWAGHFDVEPELAGAVRREIEKPPPETE